MGGATPHSRPRAAPAGRARGGGADGEDARRARRRHGRLAGALRLEGVAAHADRNRHRGRVHAARARRGDARRGCRRPVRRIPRALARCRSRPGAGARRAAGPARGSAAPRHVGDDRRSPRRRAPRPGPGDRRRRPRLSSRDPLCRPRYAADRAADRRRDRPRNARGARLAARVPSRSGGDPPHPGAARRPARADMRCRRALRRARRRRAGPRHRPRRTRPPQSRARHLDRRDLDHHRRRAHRHRQRACPRAALRTRCRRDAA